MKKPKSPETTKTPVPFIYQKEKLGCPLKIREFPWSPKQEEFINIIADKNTKIVFVDGVAGTGKTLIAIYCALKLMSEKKVGELLYLRTVAESASKSIGFLPGTSEDKFGPFITPLLDKLNELLTKPEIDMLIKEQRVQGLPVNFLRGASFNCSCIIFDEMQNANLSEAVTALTRIGKFSKFICLGDTKQSDIGKSSSFKKLIEIFDDEESRANGIYCFKLDIEDIVRSEILKLIMRKLDRLLSV